MKMDEETNQKIIAALRESKELSKIKGIKRKKVHGVEYFDLSGITIENQVFDLKSLDNVDFSHANLSEVTFKIKETIKNWRLISANLRNVSFCEPMLGRIKISDIFLKDTHIKDSDFSDIEFKGQNYIFNSDISRVKFLKTNFSTADFFDFTGSHFDECDFTQADISSCVLTRCQFFYCNLRDTRIIDSNVFGMVLEKCIVNRGTDFGKQSVLEKDKFYKQAIEPYAQVKKTFKDCGLNVESFQFYSREIAARRKFAWKKIKIVNPIELFKFAYYGLVSFFGRYFHSMALNFVTILILIFSCSILYSIGGISNNLPGKDNPNILQHSSPVQKAKNDVPYSQCLYFSVVTFTTLGYGDWTPKEGLSKVVASIECFAGPFFVAIFIILVSRKISNQ